MECLIAEYGLEDDNVKSFTLPGVKATFRKLEKDSTPLPNCVNTALGEQLPGGTM